MTTSPTGSSSGCTSEGCAGHAKYTGEVGVCLATRGPGAVHLLNGLYDAKLDRKPVVAIVGQVTSTALGSGCGPAYPL